jgi:hypothetical protein
MSNCSKHKIAWCNSIKTRRREKKETSDRIVKETGMRDKNTYVR